MTEQDIPREMLMKLKDSFVDDYDKIKESRDQVNSYINELGLEYTYEYNKFCVDFLTSFENTMELIDSINDVEHIIYESIYFMVMNVIIQEVKDETDRKGLLLIHKMKNKTIKKY
jgi:hypothetical protein